MVSVHHNFSVKICVYNHEQFDTPASWHLSVSSFVNKMLVIWHSIWPTWQANNWRFKSQKCCTKVCSKFYPRKRPPYIGTMSKLISKNTANWKTNIKTDVICSMFHALIRFIQFFKRTNKWIWIYYCKFHYIVITDLRVMRMTIQIQ